MYWSLFVGGQLVSVLCSYWHGVSAGGTKKAYEDVYDRLFKEWKRNVDRRIRPNIGEKPVDVEVFIYVLSLRSVSEATMDYKLELYFREYWQDPRLAYSPNRFNNLTKISLHESLAELLWVPDTFLPNAIYSDNPTENSISHRALLRLEPDGHLLYSRRLSITAECPMDLSLYPFDQQVCRLSIESCKLKLALNIELPESCLFRKLSNKVTWHFLDGYGTDDIIYHWRHKNPVDVNERIQLPDLKLKQILVRNRNITLATGTYSRLECCFFFVRSAGFHFVQLFIPATAIVITSWLSLWMKKESTFSDMIQVILAITFLYYSYNTVMPKVSYIKAMDIYLGTCFIFVFLSLIKLAILKFLKSRKNRQQNERNSSGVGKALAMCSFESTPILQNRKTYNNAAGSHSGAPLSPNTVINITDNNNLNGFSASTPFLFDRELSTDRNLMNFAVANNVIRRRCCAACLKMSRKLVLALFPLLFMGFCIFYFIVYFRVSESGDEEKCMFGM